MSTLRNGLFILFLAAVLGGCNHVTVWYPPRIQPPHQPDVVVLVHGIWRWPGYTMRNMLAEGKRRGYEVVYFRYSGLQAGLETNVQRLAGILEDYHDRQVSFITHSYGGLIVRRLLESRDSCDVNRLVMIGTPNQGSTFAQQWCRSLPYRWIFGLGGNELTPTGARRLSAPPCEFGILAGTGSHINPWPLGQNDGVVGVSEAYLPGASEFRVLDAGHEELQQHPVAVQASYDFLETGSFGLDPPGMLDSRPGASAATPLPD